MSACPICHTSAAKANPWLEAFPAPDGSALPSNPWAGYEPPMPESIFRPEPAPKPAAPVRPVRPIAGDVRPDSEPVRPVTDPVGPHAEPLRPVVETVRTVEPDPVAEPARLSIFDPQDESTSPAEPLIMAIDESSVLVSGVIDDGRTPTEVNRHSARRERDSAKIVMYIALAMFAVMAIALVLILL